MAGWIIDDTGIPKKGLHSVGVTRQYCGVLGKQDNCQVAVSVSLANEAVTVPGGYRLYLPESRAKDKKRRTAVGVPKDVKFQAKWQIALDIVKGLRADEMPPAPVLADAGYGVVTAFRDTLTQWQIPYVVGISGGTQFGPLVWSPWLPGVGRGKVVRPR